jgi:uncharacterized protein (DUF169 family)
MHSTLRDYSVFDKFNFERKPVGIKFLLNKPEGIDRLDKELALCEMFKEAQERSPFYAIKENFACLGSLVLGIREPEPIFESGEVGVKEGIYKEARANKRIYQYVPKLPKETVRYVAFSPIDQLSFDPDIVIITAHVSQAEILLRSLSYTTGRMLTTKSTPVIMCAWLFVYPYVSGEMNFTVTGLGSGMKARKVLPEGLMLISVPYDLLPMMIENLQDMQWILPLHTIAEDDKEYFKRTADEIRQEYLNG